MIMVASFPEGFDRRSTIRETWLKEEASFPELKVLFSFGKSQSQDNDFALRRDLEEEHDRYCDCVQFDFVDHYMNITLDSLHSMKFALGWKWKVEPEFLIISDDDSYINLSEVSKFLKSGSVLTKV